MTRQPRTAFRDPEILEDLASAPDLLAVADAVSATQARPRALRASRGIGVLLAFAAITAGIALALPSGSSGVPQGDIALVNGEPITKAQFDHALDQYNRSAARAKQPTVSGDYPVVVQQKIVPYLVQRTEFEQQAKKLGVSVSAKDIDAEIKKIVKQYFGGKYSAFLKAIKQQNSTLPEVRDSIGLNLLQQKVTAKLTAAIKVSDQEALAYYTKNKAQYEHPTSRALSHILVKTKAKADKLYKELQNGASFATLAKANSTDSGSAAHGGKLGVQAETALVKPFSTVAFSLKTGTISKPVHTQFGWHIIKANGPVIPASVTPFSKEKAAIVQQLDQAKKANVAAEWQTKVQRFYAGRVKYANGYAPPAATTPAATSLFPTAPTG